MVRTIQHGAKNYLLPQISEYCQLSGRNSPKKNKGFLKMAVYKATPKGEKGEILGQQQQRSNVTHAQRDQFYPIPAKDFKGKLKKQTLS